MLGKIDSALREYRRSVPRHDGAKTIEICVSPVAARFTLGLVQYVIREEACIALDGAMACL